MRSSKYTDLGRALCALALAVAACERTDVETTEPPETAQTRPGPGAEPREEPGERSAGCDALPGADELRRWLVEAPNRQEAGGLAGGRFQWAAWVDREGVLCAVVASTEDPAAAWPGSRGIAIAKASTANAFSTDQNPLSTARLYTLAQPGHSLFGAAAGNPLNPACVGTPGSSAGEGEVCGGTIVFGGGVPLYRGQTRVGGLGTSGDTACTDHEIAKRIRDAAGLNPPGGALADDITYAGPDGASVYTHPLCPNTWRNGQKVGDEPAASGY